MKTIKIKELGIEVMRTDETCLYKNSKVPKGWRRIEGYQLIYILEGKYRKRFLKELEGQYNLFWIKKRKSNKYYSALGGIVCRLRVYGCDFVDYVRSFAFGVFVRDLK